MVDAPRPAKKRRKRRRRELDLSSSSDSEGEEAPIVKPTAQATTPEEPDDSSSDSSAIFSSDEETGKGDDAAPASAVDAASEVASMAADESLSTARPTRERSVSPPHFGFSAAARSGKPVLWGQVPGDNAAAAPEHPDHDAFRTFYRSKLVERFSTELEGLQKLRKEVDSQDRLQMLIKSLAGGAELFLAPGAPKVQREVVLQAMAVQNGKTDADADDEMED